MELIIDKTLNLKHKTNLNLIYERNKHVQDFIKQNKENTSLILTNIDNFISFINKELTIEYNEYCFIIACLFEYDYFKDKFLTTINNEDFKYLIVRRVIDTLTDASLEDKKIKKLVKKCKFNNNIDNSFNIIKNIISSKKIKCNYCYLFDNIKYFSYNKEKKEQYLYFIIVLLKDYLYE